jgi:hypothetical protein
LGANKGPAVAPGVLPGLEGKAVRGMAVRYDIKRNHERLAPERISDGKTYRVYVLDGCFPMSCVTIGYGVKAIDVGVGMN